MHEHISRKKSGAQQQAASPERSCRKDPPTRVVLAHPPPKSIINRWQHLKALHHQHRARWMDEYFKELHKRNKWQVPTENLCVGDMVVIKDDNLPSNEWRLGRIDSVFPVQNVQPEPLYAAPHARTHFPKKVRRPVTGRFSGAFVPERSANSPNACPSIAQHPRHQLRRSRHFSSATVSTSSQLPW